MLFGDRVGDPTKELSAEFNTTLRTSIRPQTYTYPMRYAHALLLRCQRSSAKTLPQMLSSKC